ncbi:MAG: GntR family transcriptional regulator [Limibacillus sp.]
MNKKPDKSASSHVDAYDQLLAAIDSGELPPGSRLRESQLAERFGISRTPVREALRRLEAQGLVAHEPHRGVVVAQLDYDQLGELYAVREVLEGTAARLAARHASPEEIEILRDLVADHEANKRFHRQINRACHNRYLNAMLENMRVNLALLSGTTFTLAERRQVVAAEHAGIVEAIAEGDEEKAEMLARRHISNGYKARVALAARD